MEENVWEYFNSLRMERDFLKDPKSINHKVKINLLILRWKLLGQWKTE